MSGFLGIGGGPSLNTGPAQGYIDALGNLGTQFGQQYNLASNRSDSINNNWTDALKSYSDYLNTNPATNQFNATQVANAERGASESADRALANTDQDLAQRGISTNSGIGAGAIAGINEGLAANDANIRSDVGQANINRAAQNKASLADLWSGAQSTAFGQANELGQENQGLYQNLFGDANALAQEKLQNEQQNQQAPLELLSGLGGLAAGAAPILKKAPVTNNYSYM